MDRTSYLDVQIKSSLRRYIVNSFGKEIPENLVNLFSNVYIFYPVDILHYMVFLDQIHCG